MAGSKSSKSIDPALLVHATAVATYKEFDHADPVLVMDTPVFSSTLQKVALNQNGYVCPITQLANEVLHMIYAYLTPGEAANLRLMSKGMAVVGLHYLAPTVHLDLEEASFKKLRDIADHPIASKHVYELVYEVDRLESLSREDWSRRIMGPEYIASRDRGEPEDPGANADVTTRRAYLRELKVYLSMPFHRFTQGQIHQEWNHFRDAYNKQTHICHSSSLSGKLKDTLIKLPNLRSVRTSSKNTMTRWMEGFTQRLGALWDQNALVLDLPGGAWKVGLCSTQNLLRALGHHRLPITTLRLDGLNWQFLAQNKKDFMLTQECFCHLKDLSIYFTGRVTIADGCISVDVDRYDSDAFRRVKQRGRLVELLSAAPDLEALAIGFGECDFTMSTSLEETFGMFHWHSLKAIEFIAFETSETELLDFLSRHAKSLRSVNMSGMGLLGGTWSTTLHRMRQTLKLEHFHMPMEVTEPNGTISQGTGSEFEYWDVERKVFVSCGLEDLVEQYLQGHDEEDMTFTAYLAGLRVQCEGIPMVLLHHT
ncbi:hypothetical protein JMJ35_009420 [Cladonia borealis]|uniref:F-box domain-containing protein n=1 Tax=Cladonia borealis TaxID=184061 RepID=A0AA39QTX5_9LECA|nr:hypothetical protein JMJ35_009420 [Cladonia borealis]